jgi:hypothetical protein
MGECPIGVSCPLTPCNRDALADATEFFESNPASGAFGGGNDTFADRVVDDGLIPTLTTVQQLQLAFRGTSAFPLEIAPAVGVADQDCCKSSGVAAAV